MLWYNDGLMQVAFVPNTHYAFTVGKDRLLKYWDLDRWELLLDLPSHHAEVNLTLQEKHDDCDLFAVSA